jgi:alkanesulfonate monooxygenase SsuD/methylene tetrahydromethanopterin reductase-like flavin-dependent oxidoreductase (luciferase family)
MLTLIKGVFMKLSNLMAAVAMVSVVSFSGSALAKQDGDERKRPKPPTFEQLDVNGDGDVTLAEVISGSVEKVAERSQKMFEMMDVDGDGVVTEGEFEDAKEKMKEKGRPDRKRPDDMKA